ncbi:MAG: glycosyl hydrolase family 18 protein, partial [Lachnospiraceae bacterium]
HNRGMEVWGLIDNFSKEVDTKAVLSYTSKRTYLIQNIMNMLLTYNLDGINIDFESIAPDTGEHYIEFIRELSITCRANGKVLSVDNYV